MGDLRSISGLERRCFNPALASVAAWIVASGGAPTDSDVERLITLHFPQYLPPGYFRRFVEVVPLADSAPVPPTAERDSMLAEAFLEAKSDLRKLVVATVPDGSFSDDADFEKHPVYAASISQLDGIELTLTSLDELDISRCPKCRIVGEVDTWFGTRLVGGHRIPQSWCRICRSTRG